MLMSGNMSTSQHHYGQETQIDTEAMYDGEPQLVNQHLMNDDQVRQIVSNHNSHGYPNQVGAPTPNFLSMRGPNHKKAMSSGENRYSHDPDEMTEDGGQTQYTNADVTSIMGNEEMIRQQVPVNDASMV